MVLQKTDAKVCSATSNKDPTRDPISAPCRHLSSFLFLEQLVFLGIACNHAIATSRHSNIHELPDMVQIYYRLPTRHKSCTLFPSLNEWVIPDPLIVILFPINKSENITY
uniref:Uncharacterized protein n=1 Tax=Lactuca sativa TaxID=4236 RepID=A0A9R1V5S2_LACSA|nr:hypothetical protein LSAT_V11C600324490 [Lactuca sativa]